MLPRRRDQAFVARTTCSHRTWPRAGEYPGYRSAPAVDGTTGQLGVDFRAFPPCCLGNRRRHDHRFYCRVAVRDQSASIDCLSPRETVCHFGGVEEPGPVGKQRFILHRAMPRRNPSPGALPAK